FARVSLRNVPLVGNVIVVAPLTLNVSGKPPEIVKLPLTVIVLVPLLTPVPPEAAGNGAVRPVMVPPLIAAPVIVPPVMVGLVMTAASASVFAAPQAFHSAALGL